MNQIIAISNSRIGEEATQTVNARELHEFLEVSSRFNDWISNRIKDFEFTENQDFVTFTENLVSGGARKEYHLTLEMAKELSMVERNDKGKQARQYFIECERRAKQIDPHATLNDPAAMRGILLTYCGKVLELQPKADALDRLAGCDGWLCLRDAAKALKMPERKFINHLLLARWLYRDMKGKLRGYSDKTPRYISHKITAIPVDGDQDRVSMQPMITPEGLTNLAKMFNVTLEQEAA